MKYLNINEFDIANGPGFRTSLFVTGCIHNCKGCFNLLAQDFTVGDEFTQETIDYIVDSLRADHVEGLTLLGGEPMDPNNQPSIALLIKAVRDEYGDKKNIWSWTGYVYPRDFDESLGKRARAYTEHTDFILSNLDVLVDGPFVLGLKSAKLQFRGSANQKIIDMKASLRTKTKVVLELDKEKELVKTIYEEARTQGKGVE